MDKSLISSTPVQASCHCGAVMVTVPSTPQEINECQCTICRRYGAAWAYYDPTTVDIKVKDGWSVKQYIWGDRRLSFDFCEHCGCMCYWYPYFGSDIEKVEIAQGQFKMGVNTRMMSPDLLRDVNRMLTNDAIFAPKSKKAVAHAEDRAQY